MPEKLYQMLGIVLKMLGMRCLCSDPAFAVRLCFGCEVVCETVRMV